MTSESSRIPPSDLVMVADLVLPCSHCGIPCTGTVMVWFLREEIRHAIEVDRPTFDMLLGKLCVGERASDELPRFVTDWCTSTGWMDIDAAEVGTPVPHIEMTATLTRLAQVELDERERQLCDALRRVTREGLATDSPLFVYYD